ncbi:protein SFI1 homolog isoform X3 [Anguilla anguilla]|uniref:protein SFI1 homolog isoform X3 n=1 Tax=Anguilla anguilla TaxID=7936 RepID=UPI0015B17EAC|nr:protein SFI1 homolog isoform X3 [Anguilla anguilla]
MKRRVVLGFSAARLPQVPGCLGPANGKDSTLKVVPGAMHARRGLSQRVSYRVEQTCNRGGRLKDQKKRQLVQKLFYLWIRKTFGRVHPSQARTHYQQRVLWKAFEVWREEWWVTRKEWRLCMRAECHYRYRLYNWVFVNWQQFVTMQQGRKERLQTAAIYAEKRCQFFAWGRWVVYLEMQRIKRNMHEAAQKHWENTALRSAWMLWTGCLQLKKRKLVLEECALQHWALSLQSRTWLQWREVYLLACSLRKEETRASLHHSHGLQRRVLFTWTSYLHYRQVKKEQKVSSKHARHSMVLRRCWSTWQEEFLHRQNERATWQTVSALAQQRVQLRALHRWKGYTNQCLEETKINQFAREHYRRRLMRMGLRLLTLNISQRKARQINKNVALQQYQHSVIGKYWHRWQESYEEIEERNHQQQGDMALMHYSMTLLNNTLHCWRKCFSEHRIRKKMELRADRYYARWALPQFFNSWKDYVAQKKKTRERIGTAEAHIRQRTCTWAFYTWLTQSEEQRDKRLAERMAVLHADQSALLRVFVHWRSRADWEREEREKSNASARLYLNTLLHKTLCLWRDNIALIQSGRENEQQAVRHDHLLCVQKALTRWRKYVQHKREKKRKLEELDHYRHCKLLARALHGWKEYHHRAQQANRIAEERQRLHHQNLLRKALYTWKENITLLVRDKASQSRASKQYQHILLSKVLLMWREATVYAIYSRHQQEEEVKVARTYLQGVWLQQAYQRWKKRGQEVRQERLRMEKARKNHQTALLHRCIGAWVLYYHQHQHRKVMQGQANCLLLRRTCLHYFTFWKRQLQLRYEEAELTDVALWHWSFKLLAKVMEAWRCWMAERHRKQDRLVHSAQFHQDQLLREGVMRILSHTADMRSFRINLALQSQEQSARQLQNVVWRCAMLWKQRVLGEPGGCRGKTCKSVSFCLPPPISTPGSTSKNYTVGLQPRRSDHLLNSLDKASPRKSTHNRTQVLSSPPSPANPIQTMGWPTPLAPELFCSPAIAQEPLTGHKDHSTNQEVLLPPSSFMTSGVSRQHSTSTLMAQPGPSHSDMLLSTKKFTMCQAAAPTGCVSEKGKQTECELVDQQPYCHASTAVAKELLGIQWKMHNFQREKRQLRAWRRLADVLRSWLQTSTSEDETECHSTRLELEELEARMSRLATWLEEEKPVMQCYAARIHSISSCLLEN